MSDDEIRLGFNWFDIAKAVAVANAAGLPVQATGLDLTGQVRAVADWFNERGGIEGRKVVPVFHEVDLAIYLSSNQGRAQEGQRTCTAFTEDDHVFMVNYFLPMDDDLNDCVQRAGSIAFANGFIDEARFRQLEDMWYLGPGFLVDRFLRTLVDHDLRNNWKKRGARIGVLTENRPFLVRATDRVLKPALKAAGFDIKVDIVYPHYQQSPWESYVLQMQTAGVTHVYFSITEGGPYAKAFFMRAAENQGYRPVYGGINSADLLDTLPKVAPPQQLAGTTAMSIFAIDEGGVNTAPDNPDKELCRQIMSEAGQGEILGYGCEQIFLIARGLAGAGSFDKAGFQAGIESLGTSYQGLAGVGYNLTFGPGRHDPMNAVRDMAFFDDCVCYRYISEIIEIG